MMPVTGINTVLRNVTDTRTVQLDVAGYVLMSDASAEAPEKIVSSAVIVTDDVLAVVVEVYPCFIEELAMLIRNAPIRPAVQMLVESVVKMEGLACNQWHT